MPSCRRHHIFGRRHLFVSAAQHTARLLCSGTAQHAWHARGKSRQLSSARVVVIRGDGAADEGAVAIRAHHGARAALVDLSHILWVRQSVAGQPDGHPSVEAAGLHLPEERSLRRLKRAADAPPLAHAIVGNTLRKGGAKDGGGARARD